MGHSPKAAWALFACCALLLLFAPHRSLAQADHRLMWPTIEGPHFAVCYHEPLGVVARSLLGRAEEINEKIQRSLGLTLSQQVAVGLSDEDDAANGFANAIYNAMRLRVVAPDDMFPLADYDDWLDRSLTLEHTRVLHLEAASGIPRLFSASWVAATRRRAGCGAGSSRAWRRMKSRRKPAAAERTRPCSRCSSVWMP